MEDNWTFIKFRYTFKDGENVLDTAGKLIAELKREKCVYISIGIETLNGLGLPYPKHIHAHMVTQDKHSAIVKRLQRYWLTVGDERKGNKKYSCVEEESVRDLNRFLRYPLKQMTLNPLPRDEDWFCSVRSNYPERFDLLLEKILASEEYDRMVEFNQKKKAQQDAPNTKDKLFEYLDAINNGTPFKTDQKILENILIYYHQEEKSANKQTIMGYLNTALLRYKIMTPSQMAQMWLAS